MAMIPLNPDIRQAVASDIPLIRELAQRIWPSAFKGILSEEQIRNMLASIYNEQALLKEMQDGHVFWIASFGTEDAGYLSAYRKDATLWIKKLYILPNMEGRGCAKALMQSAIQHFDGCRELSLYVNRDNLAAQRFYIHSGFAKTQEVPVKMGEYDFVDYVMSRPL